jgi:hypothetical protein
MRERGKRALFSSLSKLFEFRSAFLAGDSLSFQRSTSALKQIVRLDEL